MNLEVPRGALFGLLGPNGAGKSTTLKMLVGSLKASTGAINVLGYNPWTQRSQLFTKLGYLPQNPTQHPEKTVLKYMQYMAQLKGMNRKKARLEALATLHLVGLGKLAERNVSKLSGGEKQRLGFANALIGDPELLILDEPTASLDPEGRIYVMELISQYTKEKNKTIIVSSHILPEIQRMTDHIAILVDGSVLVQGPMWKLTENVFDTEYLIQTSHSEELLPILQADGFNAQIENGTIYVNELNGQLEKLWVMIPKICSDNNWRLQAFRPVHDALENVFLDYIQARRVINE